MNDEIIEAVSQLEKVHKADLLNSISHAVAGNQLDEVHKSNLLHISDFLKELLRLEKK